jgi:hypothetical protein
LLLEALQLRSAFLFDEFRCYGFELSFVKKIVWSFQMLETPWKATIWVLVFEED